MFGLNNNQEDSAQSAGQQNGQSIDGVVPPEPTTPIDTVAKEEFNPALPTPGTSFGSDADDKPTDDTPPSDPAPKQDDILDTTSSSTNDLLDIKQHALNQLSPLVGHLEQTPEERFRTTMMMIQASDNQDLVKDAYAAAQEITDEKAKAQALLDIVNEINYFTQHHQG